MTRTAELEALAHWLWANAGDEHRYEPVFTSVLSHLDAARDAVVPSGTRPWWLRMSFRTGRRQDRAIAHIDAAEEALLRVAPASYIRGQMPRLEGLVRRLPFGDPRRLRAEEIAGRVNGQDLTDTEREALVSAVGASNQIAHAELMRLRQFRNLVAGATATMVVLVITFAVVGAVAPSALPLCFPSESPEVCPTGAVSDDGGTSAGRPGDVALVELLGAVGAIILGASSLRPVARRVNPGLGSALAWSILLKPPTGALTAVLGLLLVRGDFLPGLGAFDSASQILAWALIFGSASQLVTRQVDVRTEQLLSETGEADTVDASNLRSEALDSAVASVLRSAHQPQPLVNYRGVLAVELHDESATAIPPDDDGRFVVTQGESYRLHATLGPEELMEGTQVPVVIEDGDTAERVPFEIELDTADLSIERAEHAVSIIGDGGRERVTWELSIDADLHGATLWMRLMQRGRLIQLVEIELVASARA